ncbi:MAG: LysM peptidoglycan-binding domain-containing protein, partial [Syntrophales bacterium]
LSKGKYDLLVPKGAAAGFQARYEGLVKKWQGERKEHVYVVKKGDNLSSIASDFNVPLPALLIWNHLGSKTQVKPGDRLFIYPEEVKSEK